MAKSRQKKTLDDTAILSLYQSVLPFLYFNPNKVHITSEVNKWLLDYIHYDFYHSMMDEAIDNDSRQNLTMTFMQWGNKSDTELVPSISFQPADAKNLDPFEQAVKASYAEAMTGAKKRWPDVKEYYYYPIRSNDAPRIEIGFFRHGPENPFTEEERELLEELTPHLLLLFRCDLNKRTESQAFHYFDGFAKLASRLAEQFKLSSSEMRLIPDLLFGYSNEAIAERQFISVPTVKSHINHILKKTGTKNRHDLIGKFFTSPEHVQL
jgi:DNA-binding CsgD family transcriptional regulator